MALKKERFAKRLACKYSAAMLIDDSEIDNFINQKVLESNFFAEMIYVNTGGVSALEFLRNLTINEELAPQLLPQVIFVDLNMPQMDGFQFISLFMDLPDKFRSRCRLVILTSSVNPEDQDKARTLYNEILFLNKPLTAQSLALIPLTEQSLALIN